MLSKVGSMPPKQVLLMMHDSSMAPRMQSFPVEFQDFQVLNHTTQLNLLFLKLETVDQAWSSDDLSFSFQTSLLANALL